MKNLFRLMLIIMCGVGVWGCTVAIDNHQFVMSATATCLSGFMFVLTIKED